MPFTPPDFSKFIQDIENLSKEYARLKKPAKLQVKCISEDGAEYLELECFIDKVEEDKAVAENPQRDESIKTLQAGASGATIEDFNGLYGLALMLRKKLAQECFDPTDRILGIPLGGKAEALARKVINLDALPAFVRTGAKLYGLYGKILCLPGNTDLDCYRNMFYFFYATTFMKEHKLSEKDCALSQSYYQENRALCLKAIKGLSQRRFGPLVVKDNMARIPQEYKEGKEKQGKPPGRVQELAMIKVMSHQLLYSDEHHLHFNNLLRHALGVRMMKDLEGTLFGRSTVLYQCWQKALNLDSTSDLNHLDIYTLFSALHHHLPKLDPHQEAPTHWLIDPIPNGAQYISDMTTRLLEDMTQSRQALERNQIYRGADAVRSVVNFLMYMGVHTVIGVAAGALVNFAPGQNPVSRVAGWVGQRYYGYAGRFIGHRVGLMAEQAAATSLVVYAMKYVSSGVTEIPGNAVYFTLTLPFNIAQMIYKYCKSPAEKPFFETGEFLEMLLSAPNEDVEPDIKDKIRKSDIYQAYLMEKNQPMIEMKKEESSEDHSVNAPPPPPPIQRRHSFHL